MPDRDAREISIAEAEWRLIAAECRLLLSMRNRTGCDDDPGPAPVGRLIDDLAQAAARLRAVSGREAQEPAPAAADPAPRGSRGLSAGSNGSFTKPLQIGGG